MLVLNYYLEATAARGDGDRGIILTVVLVR
jgi:hypothetical protein